MRLVIEKSGSGARWVLVKSEEEVANARSQDRAESFCVNDPGSLEMTSAGNASEGSEYGAAIVSLEAVADEEWWNRLKGDPKRAGEVSQAAFLLKARKLGFGVAIPWGDSESNDFIVWAKRGAEMLRVQVKGTGRLHRRGYEVQPVHSTRGQGKKRYTKKDIDVLVAHVQPVDAWYLIPIETVGRAKSLRFYPDIKSRRPKWEQWREKWEVLGER